MAAALELRSSTVLKVRTLVDSLRLDFGTASSRSRPKAENSTMCGPAEPQGD